MIHIFYSVGGNKGVSVRLGCRRGGSRSKATAVVLYFGLISPKRRQSYYKVIVNLTQLSADVSLDFSPVELVARLWNNGVCREFE